MKRYLSHAFHIFNGTSAIYLIGLITNIYVARVLGPQSFGLLIIGISVLSYSMLFSDIGLRQLGLLETSRPDNLRDFQYGEIFFIKLIQGIFIFFSAQIFIRWFYADKLQQTIISFYLLGILCDALFLDWFYRGLQKFKLISYVRIISSALYLLSIFVFIKTENDLILVPLLYTAQMLVPSLALILTINQTPFKIIIPNSFSRYLLILRQAIYIGLSEILNQIHILLPPIIIGKILTSKASGFYGAAFKILVSAGILDIILINIFLTSFYKMWHQSKENAEQNVQMVLNFCLFFGFGISLFLSITSPIIINLIFGSEYTGSIKILSITSWFIAITLLNSIFSLIFVSLGNKRIFLFLNILGAVISTIIMFISISKYGVIGAAISLVISELIFVLIFFISSRKYCKLSFFPAFFKVLLVCFVSYRVFLYLPFNLIINSSFSLLSFLLFSLLFKIVTLNDIKLIKTKWNNS